MIKQIKPNIYSVGILNPNLRIFDIIMPTKFGTSYNSYLIKDGDQTILIDGCHDSYSKQYFNNINEVSNIKSINTLIINHCEPDHTGAIRKLIEANSEIKIYCTKTSSIFLKGITNINNLNIHTIQDGEELKINSKTFKFVVAPFLHWPDSMFTYLIEDKIAFTCDFLGSHYCEPTMIDTQITYVNEYWSAFKNYYDAIFGPFKQHVKFGLGKLANLTIETVCPSHGPVLTSAPFISESIKKYDNWSNPTTQDFIPIFYCSAYGNTEKIANAIGKGIESKGLKQRKFNVIEHSDAELAAILNSSQTFCIGSPTLNRNTLEPIWKLLGSLDAVNMKKAKCLIFGSFGWSGESCNLIKSYLENLGIIVHNQHIKINFVPSQEDLEKATTETINFLG